LKKGKWNREMIWKIRPKLWKDMKNMEERQVGMWNDMQNMEER
jgi:hypothetical protein